MSNLFATAGARIYIGPRKPFTDPEIGSDFTASSFTGLTWVEIGGVTNLGSSGDTAELITTNHVGSNRTRKMKGTFNAGSMELVMDADYADPGQIALIAAAKDPDETYSFRIVFRDAPAGGTPSERLFVALVMGAAEELGEANNLIKLNATLEIDSNIVRVAAAPGA